MVYEPSMRVQETMREWKSVSPSILTYLHTYVLTTRVCARDAYASKIAMNHSGWHKYKYDGWVKINFGHISLGWARHLLCQV